MRRINPAPRVQAPAYGKSPARSAGAPSAVSRQPSLASSDSPWRIGQSVVHAKFGAGVIVGSEGSGADARVQVNFRSGGLKWLALEYANLIPA
jgi:DNA helicase-2/ATP-dependent DNA helicase PcrA